MNNKINEAALLFAGGSKNAFNKEEAINIISATGVAVKDTETIDVLGNEISHEQLVDIAGKLRAKQYTVDELTKLFTNLNASGNGTVNRGTIVYILKTNHHIPDDQIDAFLADLNLTEQNGFIRVDELVKALLTVLKEP
ncbi:uncharacterized protein BBOV_IV003565 [Babesia bovis T2Bo]|uniref:uncharacterized protein n=1 Tax=Babesia bovis T2Bo TaxID=484906 RepID=UPI001DCD3B0D|nr:uncharacterized protein BBOV_IV003565 [Babesia bovis T2Bo]KAG6439900.1 hypothetical protein BBOV_IV003565 [Babesia bovis T2Bo]